MQNGFARLVESTEVQVVAERALQTYEHSTVHGHGRAHFGNNIYTGPIYQSSGSHGPKADTEKDVGNYHAILESLKFREMHDRHATISAAYAKTCRWFFTSHEYMSWRRPDDIEKHHGFLWIKGKPGAGKSTLIKCAFDDDVTQPDNKLVVSFFFNARGEDLQTTAQGMYRSVLYQILEHLPETFSLLPARIQRSEGHHVWPLNLLKDLLRSAISGLTTQMICYVDALDECVDAELRDMVGFFEDLSELARDARVSLLICFASRHFPYVSMHACQELILDNERGHVEDIAEYVQRRLIISNTELATSVRQRIEQRASGVFLWVVLVVRLLNDDNDRGHVQNLAHRLETIPDDLYKLFQGILRSGTNDKNDLTSIIVWTLFSCRPLTLEELYFGVLAAQEPRGMATSQPEVDTSDGMRRFVLDASKGLVEMTYGGHAQFIHESVRAYLLKDGLATILGIKTVDLDGYCHERLKNWCQQYIASPVPELSATISKWLSQSHHTGHDPATQIDMHSPPNPIIGTNFPAELQLLYGSYRFPPVSQVSYRGSDRYRFRTPRSMSPTSPDSPRSSPSRNQAFHDRNQLSRDAFGTKDARNVERMFPLSRYAMTGLLYHADTAAKFGITQVTFVRTFPYEAWVELHNIFENFEVVLQLPFAGNSAIVFAISCAYNLLDIAIMDATSVLALNRPLPTVEYQTILGLAIDRGDYNMLDKLLSRGVDADSLGSGRQRCLKLALRRGNAPMVRRLVKAGATIKLDTTLSEPSNERGGHSSDLRLAVSNGLTLVRAILDEDVYTPGRWNAGYTDALVYAILTGKIDAARMFIERLDALDSSMSDVGSMSTSARHGILGFALVAASGSGRAEILELLLSRNIDIDAREHSAPYNTPLQAACMQGSVDNVEVLLQHGASVNVVGGDFGSALQTACLKGSPHIVRMLLTAGADVNVRGGGYETALQAACYQGSEEVVQMLLTSGADVNVQGGEYGAALQAASYWGYTRLVEMLLRAGANVNTLGGEFGCAMEAAIKSECWSTVDQLLRGGADKSVLSQESRWALGEKRQEGIL